VEVKMEHLLCKVSAGKLIFTEETVSFDRGCREAGDGRWCWRLWFREYKRCPEVVCKVNQAFVVELT
jgi:hypothetical protein